MSSLLRKSLLLCGFIWIIDSQLDRICEISIKDPWPARFDLSPYMGGYNENPNDYYCVKDSLAKTDPDRNYTYCFNVCKPVQSIPKGCNSLPESRTCKVLNTSHSTCETLQTFDDIVPSWAYQIKNKINNTDCWRLSSDHGGEYMEQLSRFGYPTTHLLDVNDPVAGIVYSYDGGDYAPGCGRNRKFNIKFVCENKRYSYPKNGLVTENACEYNLTIPTIYGCPVECPLYSNEICSAQGLCGYDFNKKSPRCFCFSGFMGDDCSKSGGPKYTTPKEKNHDKDAEIVNINMNILVNHSNANGELKAVDMDVTFDLTPFYLVHNFYQVDDLRKAKATANYTYYFDVMDDLIRDYLELPVECQLLLNVTGPCTANCDSKDPVIGNFSKAYAFQYDNTAKRCFLLGTDYTYELYKEDDWARGVTLKYINGGHDDGCQTDNGNRQFTINFICPDSNNAYEWDSKNMYEYGNDLIGLATYDTYVIENEGNKYGDTGKCGYFIDIKNSQACPWQCITPVNDKEFQICSGHGKCAADPYAGFVRCICDYGFIGDNCDIPYVPKGSTIKEVIKRNPGWLIFALFVIILAILILALGYRKYKRDLKKIEKKYQQNLIDEDSMDTQNISHGITSINPNKATEMNVSVDVGSSDDDDDDNIKQSQQNMVTKGDDKKKKKKKKKKTRKGYDQMMDDANDDDDDDDDQI